MLGPTHNKLYNKSLTKIKLHTFPAVQHTSSINRSWGHAGSIGDRYAAIKGGRHTHCYGLKYGAAIGRYASQDGVAAVARLFWKRTLVRNYRTINPSSIFGFFFHLSTFQ